MKKICTYFIGLLFMAVIFGNPISILAAEETSTMMCDGGVVEKGDTEADVREKCGHPYDQSINKWIYNPGPSQSFTVIFEEGKVVRILESH